MAHSAMTIANAFIRKAKNGEIQGLTPMKLQKLMFFAQSWYLKKYSRRLFDDNFECWRHGPVIPSIYFEFATFGGNEIDEYARDSKCQNNAEPLSPNDENFIDEIIKVYGGYTGWQLSWMTHQEGTAWSNARSRVITDQELYDGDV